MPDISKATEDAVEYRDWLIEYEPISDIYTLKRLRNRYGDYEASCVQMEVFRYTSGAFYDEETGSTLCSGTSALCFESVEQCKALIDSWHRINERIDREIEEAGSHHA